MVVFCVFEWCLYKKSIVAPGISGLLSVFFALFAPGAFPGAPGPMIFPLVVRNEGHPATYDLYFILNTTLIGGAKLVPMCVSMPISFRPPSTHHFRHHIRRFFRRAAAIARTFTTTPALLAASSTIFRQPPPRRRTLLSADALARGGTTKQLRIRIRPQQQILRPRPTSPDNTHDATSTA